MEEYLNKLKYFYDQLILTGAPIAMDDLILHALNGLDADYNAIVVKLCDKLHLTWVDLQAAFFAFEIRLNKLNGRT